MDELIGDLRLWDVSMARLEVRCELVTGSELDSVGRVKADRLGESDPSETLVRAWNCPDLAVVVVAWHIAPSSLEAMNLKKSHLVVSSALKTGDPPSRQPFE